MGTSEAEVEDGEPTEEEEAKTEEAKMVQTQGARDMSPIPHGTRVEHTGFLLILRGNANPRPPVQ